MPCVGSSRNTSSSATARVPIPKAPEAIPAENDEPIVLHYFQREAIEKILKALENGKTRIGVSAPTGSGKTMTFLHMIKDIPKRKVLRKRFRESVVDTEQGISVPGGMSADIIIATWQSLNMKRIKKYNPELFKCVIVDEAHRSVAKSYLQQLHWFNDEVRMTKGVKPFARANHGHRVPIIGFSGTLARDDRKPLGLVYEEVVYHIGLQTLSEENFLAKIDHQPVWSMIEPLLNHIRQTHWMIAQKGEFLDLVIQIYQEQSVTPRSTLIFCPTTNAAEYLTQQFRLNNVNAAYVHQKTPESKRQSIDRDFKSGVLPVLVNVKVYVEGADIPPIDSVILASPTKSKNTLSQQIGRGTRQSSDTGKTRCVLIDMFAILQKAGLSVEPCLWPEGFEEYLPSGPPQAMDWEA